jgi:cytochrome c-type biogenesis protein CcmE
MKKRYLIGGIVLIVFFVLAFISFDQGKIEYSDVLHAKESGKTVQIIGKWEKDKETNYDSQKNQFLFYIRDEKDQIVKVIHAGVRPNNFEMAESVVVKGRYENGAFASSEILTKCPSKYEAKAQDIKQ